MDETSGKTTKPLISYVLPTYNRVEYLGECLCTLMEQKYPKDKYEVIVVDDGSTDSTDELMDYFISENKNVRYFKLPHKGVQYARNFGNKKAKADLIGVCDSDDLYHENRTRITINYFNSHPNVDIVNGSYMEINHRGLPVKEFRASRLDKKLFLAAKSTFFCHDNCAYRKDKILKKPYREWGDRTDDWVLVNDWIKAGYNFGHIDKELCKVRTINKGIMGERRAKLGLRLPHAE